MNNNQKLALLGGEPLRTSKFSSEPMIGNEEVELVTSLIKKKQFSQPSRFI